MERIGTPRVCVAGAVIRNGRVLLVHRSPDARLYPNFWDLFGGHVNAGESLEEALCREASEELGIEVLVHRRLGQIDDPVEPAVVHVYEVSSWDGVPVNAAPEEHTEIRWFDAGDLPLQPAWDVYGDLVLEALDRSATQRVCRPSVWEAPPSQDSGTGHGPSRPEA